MLTRTVSVRNRLGLHARAAAKFVQLAAGYASRLQVTRGDRTVDGKSIMGILLLAASWGTTLTLTADGDDEASALDALIALVNDGFGEGTWNG